MEPSGAHSSTSLRCYSRTIAQATTSSSPANDPSASFLWDDQLCPWHPSLAGLVAVTAPLHPTLPIPTVCSFKSWTPVPGPAGLSGSRLIRTTMPTYCRSQSPDTPPSLQCEQRYQSCVPTRQALHRRMHSKSSRHTYSRGRLPPCHLSPSLLTSCGELLRLMTELTG